MTAHRRKKCRTCLAEKSIVNFYRAPRCRDGHRLDCKECVKAYVLENQRLKRETVRARNRKYEQSEAGKARRRRYLANGGQALANEAARMKYRIRKMEQQVQQQPNFVRVSSRDEVTYG